MNECFVNTLKNTSGTTARNFSIPSRYFKTCEFEMLPAMFKMYQNVMIKSS